MEEVAPIAKKSGANAKFIIALTKLLHTVAMATTLHIAVV